MKPGKHAENRNSTLKNIICTTVHLWWHVDDFFQPKNLQLS